jgi:transposase-like protein
VEVDECYFGARRVRGKPSQGAAGKTPVFGLLKRQGKVYTEMVPDCKKATPQAIIREAIIRGRVSPEVAIHSDGWRGYDGLVGVGYAKHFRVDQWIMGLMSLLAALDTSTALRAFGALLNAACKSSMACPVIRFTCTSKSASGVSTIETLTSTRNCSSCLDNIRFKHLNYLRPFFI